MTPSASVLGTPVRLAVRIPVDPDPGPDVDLHPFIGVFHRFIQEAAVDGLLIDVADYAHVPEGPGVILIGHDVDYGMDQAGGTLSLLTTRKRTESLSFEEAVRDALRKALVAARAIEADPTTQFRFDPRSLTVHLIDRLVAPSSPEGFEAASAAVAPVFEKLFVGGYEVSRVGEDDERRPLSLRVTTDEAVDLDALVGRLGGRAAAAASDAGEITPEELKRLRDEGADFVLVDVREHDEVAICHLDGLHIPLGELPSRLGELDRAADIVVHCKVGGRGGKAADALREAGFAKVRNLKGGILAWIERIDASLTKY